MLPLASRVPGSGCWAKTYPSATSSLGSSVTRGSKPSLVMFSTASDSWMPR